MLDFSSQRDYGVSSQAWEIHSDHMTYHCSTSKELPKGIRHQSPGQDAVANTI